MPSAPTEPPALAKNGCERRTTLELQQLARAVRRGQRITAYLPEEKQVSGYLAGIDDTTWFILDPDQESGCVRHWLIPKALSPALEIHTRPTYSGEPDRMRKEMELIIVHLRTWVKNNVLGD